VRVHAGHEREKLAVTQVRSEPPPAASAPVTVVELDPAADPRWDALVLGDQDAGAYHLGAWAAVLREAYGQRPCYLALEAADGSLRAGLPMMYTRGIATGRRMRSLPVLPPAGPLARSEDDARLLLEAACERTDAARARIWSLHARRPGLDELVPRLVARPKHPTYVLPLDGDPDELRRGWKKGASNLFRSLRKAEKAGVTVREAASDADVRRFHALYARTMRRRRVVPRPYAQIAAARRLLPDGVFRLLVAEHDGAVVAGALFHSFRSTLDLLYNGSDERRLDVRPNHALYWRAIVMASEAGHSELDFGHARPGSGLARFKEQWGAQRVPEYRYDYVPGGAPRSGGDANGEDGASGGPGLRGRAIERMPLPLLALTGRVAYRRL
jgi:CelD/BcsL family acetyltransferase involved in cellulose biosynthesis